MQLPLWLSAVILFQWMPTSNSEAQDNLQADKKDGCSETGEQLPVDNPTVTCDLGQEKCGETSPGRDPPAEKSGGQMRHRKESAVKPEQQQGEADVVSSTPRQLEEATKEKAGLTEEVKFEKQVALALLTFSAGAVINAKGATIARHAGPPPVAGGSELHVQGFLFWVSIGLWFTSMLLSMFIVLLATFVKSSRGLVIWSKIVNYFNICVTVVGVAAWIFS